MKTNTTCVGLWAVAATIVATVFSGGVAAAEP